MDKVKLGTVMTLHRGYDLPNAQRKSGDVPVISSSGISGSHSVAKLVGENVITGRCGTIGEVFYHNGPCWPLNTTLFVEDFHGNDPKYVAYLLEVMLNALQIDGTDKSTVPGVDRNVLHDLVVPYISDLASQKTTTRVLSAIDAKIANNKKLIAELEETARLIYDYWFTQFDFPDENGRPYRSNGGTMVWSDELKREIPEGWEAQQVGSLVIANRGVSYSSKNLANTGTPMINLASFSPDYTYNEDGLKHFNGAFSSDKALRPYDLVICNTQQTSLDPAKDIIGKPLLIPDIFESEVISSHHVTTIHVDSEEMKAYLYSLFKTKWFSAYITGYATGTSILGLDPNGLSRLWIPVPSKSLLVAYKSFLMPLEQKKSNLINETSKLKSLRDWMLPMLMNGQLIVE